MVGLSLVTRVQKHIMFDERVDSMARSGEAFAGVGTTAPIWDLTPSIQTYVSVARRSFSKWGSVLHLKQLWPPAEVTSMGTQMQCHCSDVHHPVFLILACY